jgi:hypothetical protein
MIGLFSCRRCALPSANLLSNAHQCNGQSFFRGRLRSSSLEPLENCLAATRKTIDGAVLLGRAIISVHHPPSFYQGRQMVKQKQSWVIFCASSIKEQFNLTIALYTFRLSSNLLSFLLNTTNFLLFWSRQGDSWLASASKVALTPNIGLFQKKAANLLSEWGIESFAGQAL